MDRKHRKTRIGRHFRILVLGLLTVILLLGSPVVKAQNLSGGSKHEAVKIKVGFYPLDGFFEYDQKGNPSGYGVDFLNELKKYANIDWEFVPCDSWEGIKQKMIDGEVDVRMPVSAPTNPSGDYDYTLEPVLSTYHAIMTLKSRTDLYYQDEKAIRNMKIGLIKSLNEKTEVGSYLHSIGADKSLVYFEDYNTCKAALEAGKIDGLVSNVMDLTDQMKILEKFCVVDNYITTWTGNQRYSIINNAMTQLKLTNPSFQSDLFETYFPDWAMEPLTKEEMQYIDNHKTLTVAVYDNRRPVSYLDQTTNTFQGIGIDVANQIAKKLGLNFHYISIDTDNVYDMLDKADLVMPVPQNADESRFFTTNAFLEPDIYMAINGGEEALQDGIKLGVLSSTKGIIKAVKEQGNYQLVYFDTSDEALSALQKGKIAAFANSSYVINWNLQNPRYDGINSLHYQSFPLAYCMAGLNRNIVLQSILNKGISAMSQDTLDQIIQKDSAFSVNDLTILEKLNIYHKQIIISFGVFFLLLLMLLWYNHSKNKYILQIQESSMKQKKANHAKSEFLARMSHDMRTPLNVIIGMERFARENDNPADTQECLDKINIASEFLLGLINDVLDMEHIESGKMKLHLTPYSGEEFAKYIDSVITPLCQQKNVHFSYEFEGPNSFVILQDKLRINQIYFNLLSNAVKFTPEGGHICFKTIASYSDDQHIFMDVYVTDDGIGMSAKFQKQMFRPFTQENQEMKPLGEGTGLGLSIVKKICDLMDMTISVDSQPEKGTTFHLSGEYEIAEEQKTVISEQEKTIADADRILKDQTILICEDHPLNQEIICRLLEKKKMVPVIADNGQRGVEAFSHSAPGEFCAILMDIRMPVMDGLQATEHIRRMEREDAKRIPIIALTANAYDEDLQACKAAGMNAHLAKPIDTVKLYQTLTEQVSESLD